MTITAEMAKDLRGSEVYDAHDEKLGKVGEVYVDNSSGTPKWVTVSTGMLGTKETFVPLDGARTGQQGIRVATDKKTVHNAPNTGQKEGQLSESEERDLYSHYGLTRPGADAQGTGGRAGTDRNRSGDRQGTEGMADQHRGGAKDHGTKDHGAGDHGMTRAEERLAVGKESVETGTVSLRKYVVTETETVQVPVSHEEVRLEREPISGNRPARGEMGDEERSVTLHAERPVVTKEAHEVERVRLDARTVTENQTVSDEVRKERIDVDDPSHAVQGKHGKHGDDSSKNTENR